MQFLVIGRDYKDKDALKRRMVARPNHIKLGDELVKSGNIWYGASLRDESNDYVGSVFIANFPSRKELDEWLEKEPYVTGKVWEKIEIQNANVREPWQFNRPKEWFEERQNG